MRITSGAGVDAGLALWVGMLKAPTIPFMALEGMAVSGAHYLWQHPDGPHTIIYTRQPNSVADSGDDGDYLIRGGGGGGGSTSFDPCNLLTHPGHVYGGAC